MVLNGTSSQEYPVNAEVSEGLILCPTIFLLLISDLSIYAHNTNLYSKYYQAPDQWQQLELGSELESNLRDIVE